MRARPWAALRDMQWRRRRFVIAILSTAIIFAMTPVLTGLANGFRLAAINAGSHVGPTFGGDTIYAWSEVLEKAELPGRGDLGVLRMRLITTKDCPCDSFPGKQADGTYHPAVTLDLDYWVLMPRRA